MALMTQGRVDDMEHDSGLRPLGEYPDHCRRCHSVFDLRARQAKCSHDYVSEIRVMTGEVIARHCEDCRMSLHDV